MSYKVYWFENDEPHAQGFLSGEIDLSLKFCEGLRARQYSGEDVSFVSLCSEDPNNVTKMGVDNPSPDYNWKKRRS